VVLPEILDSLAENDPAAVANRRDLRRLNVAMGNFRWMRRVLARFPALPATGAEWAAGDGSLGDFLFRTGLGIPLTGIDRWSRPERWPRDWSWWQGDLRDGVLRPPAPLVVGNLILHHFSDGELAELGAELARTGHLLVFNETARTPWALALARLLRLAGAHPVTRHDALVSVRAGFRAEELPSLLGLASADWEWTVRIHPLGAYRMVARRRS
jgi:hypothetical protein